MSRRYTPEEKTAALLPKIRGEVAVAKSKCIDYGQWHADFHGIKLAERLTIIEEFQRLGAVVVEFRPDYIWYRLKKGAPDAE